MALVILRLKRLAVLPVVLLFAAVPAHPLDSKTKAAEQADAIRRSAL